MIFTNKVKDLRLKKLILNYKSSKQRSSNLGKKIFYLSFVKKKNTTKGIKRKRILRMNYHFHK